EAIDTSRVPHVVFVSAQGAQLAEGVGIIGHLHDVEAALARTAAVLTILRCARMLDDFERMLPSMRERGVLPNFNLEDHPHEFISAQDVGEQAAKALLARPTASRMIELAGPADYSPRQVAAAFSKAMGKRIENPGSVVRTGTSLEKFAAELVARN